MWKDKRKKSMEKDTDRRRKADPPSLPGCFLILEAAWGMKGYIQSGDQPEV